MRYSRGHKDATRTKVLRIAAAHVRAKGPDGVGVAEIMAEAGLTHGGFYAHFPSKQALVAAAVEEAFAQSRRRYARMTEGLAPHDALAALVDTYVSREHCENRRSGCPIVALESDLPRQAQPIRDAFDAGVKALIGRVAAWLPEDVAAGATERENMAASLVAEMAGTVALARAVSDEALADRLLEEGRTRIKARMGLSEPRR